MKDRSLNNISVIYNVTLWLEFRLQLDPSPSATSSTDVNIINFEINLALEGQERNTIINKL